MSPRRNRARKALSCTVSIFVEAGYGQFSACPERTESSCVRAGCRPCAAVVKNTSSGMYVLGEGRAEPIRAAAWIVRSHQRGSFEVLDFRTLLNSLCVSRAYSQCMALRNPDIKKT
eukprot:1212780-Prymnesium_polylepis.1